MFFSYFFSSLVFGPQGLKADLGVQRNKSQTWRADASLDEKAEKVLEVLNFVQHTFHRHCKDWPEYESEWTAASILEIKDVMNAEED